ncbi:rhodanese-like domain-containing protein [Congregibacter litoralis]|uniref:Rhodanese-related protein sulfurtransferase n=1 Tax=Congregibacter litoralis KT71 TaxID=314285 RepID=A4ADQ3_9GAMM|nr:rhodanese-like domain-containing protein [Congregibacter litoralis]EAQ95861.1 Rhodanese-related protein sulfurtransferase [Congregibacter litoralis KT71]
MTDFPLNVIASLGTGQAFFIYAVIGFAFGWVLESSGFGNSRKLAAQFYFQELTVLKVMFTAIVTAMTLVFAASGAGLLDYNLLWVPPTYIWPGIVGGFVMGVGFIIGGFCPGTSLVAAATLKVDGIFFVLGALFGIALFGETIGFYEHFFNSSFLGRITLSDSTGLTEGTLTVVIVLGAIGVFAGAEWLEERVGKIPRAQAPRWRYGAGALLILGAVLVALNGQPGSAERWERIASVEQLRLDHREVHVDPLEVLSLLHDDALRVQLLDLRGEFEFNRFHIRDARHLAGSPLPELAAELIAMPANTVFVLIGRTGDDMEQPWRALRAESVPNLYILDGGAEGWLRRFTNPSAPPVAPRLALGDRHPASDPNPRLFEGSFEPKVEMEIKRAPSGGGCG